MESERFARAKQRALSTRARYRRRVSSAVQRPVVRVVPICRTFIVRHLMATRHRRRSVEWRTVATSK